MQADDEWMAYVGPHGALQDMLSQQQGVLVGPRPERQPAPDPSVGPNSILSGEQLLMLLQSMGAGGLRLAQRSE